MKNYRLWLKIAAILQLLTGLIHAASLFMPPISANDTEKQMMDLMQNYHMELGGMHPTMWNLMIALSSCYSLLCLFGGSLNWYLVRKNLQMDIMKGVLNINLIIFGICFTMMAVFTFWPPIILTGKIIAALVLARLTINSSTA